MQRNKLAVIAMMVLVSTSVFAQKPKHGLHKSARPAVVKPHLTSDQFDKFWNTFQMLRNAIQSVRLVGFDRFWASGQEHTLHEAILKCQQIIESAEFGGGERKGWLQLLAGWNLLSDAGHLWKVAESGEVDEQTREILVRYVLHGSNLYVMSRYLVGEAAKGFKVD
jgi:hypothetical protein